MRKKIKEIIFEADQDRLYGRIDIAIEYLKEIKEIYKWIDIRLSEDRVWYEDMVMSFRYTREETDEEYNERIEEVNRIKLKKQEEKKQTDLRNKKLQGKCQRLLDTNSIFIIIALIFLIVYNK